MRISDWSSDVCSSDLYMTAEHHGVPLVEQFIKIGEQLLLPFIIGQCLRHWIGDWIMRNKSRVGLVDRTVIVMIVFNSFCDETVAGVWTRLGAEPLLTTALLTGALLAVIMTLTSLVATRLKFDVEVACSTSVGVTRKSMESGAPAR